MPSAQVSLCCLLVLLLFGNVEVLAGTVYAAERTAARVLVFDAIARSNRPVRVESRVVETGMMGARGIGGEKLTLSVDGTEVATALTGGDGRAYFEFEPRRIGLHTMKVALANSPRVLDATGTGTLAVWEKRKAILLIEQAVLFEAEGEPVRPTPPLPRLSTEPSLGTPSPGAAQDLSRLGHFFYNLIYLVPSGSTDLIGAETLRNWLSTHHFPPGVVLAVPMATEGLEDFVSQLKADGWENLRAGVGRSPAFAQALVAQRLRVVIHSTKPQSEFPRKAKVVDNWTAVRKQLQD